MSRRSAVIASGAVGLERLAKRAEVEGEHELAKYIRAIDKNPEILQINVSGLLGSVIGLAIKVIIEDCARKQLARKP